MRSFNGVAPGAQRLSRDLKQDFADMAGLGHEFVGCLGLFQGKNPVGHRPYMGSQPGLDLSP
jgi:hypothetical protein